MPENRFPDPVPQEKLSSPSPDSYQHPPARTHVGDAVSAVWLAQPACGEARDVPVLATHRGCHGGKTTVVT